MSHKAYALRGISYIITLVMALTRLNPDKAESAVAKGAHQIIERAIKTGVTDIHVEPNDSYLLVRYRRAGSLYLANKIPNLKALSLIKHLKSLANLDTSNINEPQSGNSTLKSGRREYQLTISTLPLIKGEKVTIHINSTGAPVDDLRAMGIWGPTRRIVERTLGSPRGLVLVTGRNPEALSRSIVSFLSQYGSLPVKVAMIGVNTFAPKAVKSTVPISKANLSISRQINLLIREEINVLGVNPVIDHQTATAVLSAINGGILVFGGIPASSLAQGLVSIQYLIKEPLGLIPDVVCVGQNEVRGICPGCREKYMLSSVDRQTLDKFFGTSKTVKIKQLHELEKEALKDKLEPNLPLTSTTSSINQLWRSSSHGCKQCDYTGYAQSVGLFEACRLSDDLKKHLLEGALVSEIYKTAVEEGMISLLADAFVKALRGMIDLPTLISVASLK